jgi:carbon-monoxide dehydrogenase small subunit/isoquinoline 1-oxidoreductase alpha subunit/xanthine dehydrogenase YagT iron-sulfur-binding subunit
VSAILTGRAPKATRAPLTLLVNGRTETVLAAPGHTLLDVLRRELRLVGAREGCGVGVCGACTVLLDGYPVSSCLLPAALATDRAITTVEGLAGPRAGLHPVQRAFVEHNAFQCSYCTPGFVLATVGLLDEQPDASEREVREYLSGNLCRCGCYREIVEAALTARDALQLADRSAKGDSVDS